MTRLSDVLWQAHITFCDPIAKTVDAAVKVAYDRVKDYLTLEKMIIGQTEFPIAHVTDDNLYCLDPLDRQAKYICYSFGCRTTKALLVEFCIRVSLADKKIELFVQQISACCDEARSSRRLGDIQASFSGTYEMQLTSGFPEELTGPMIPCDNTGWVEDVIATVYKHECVTHVPRFNFKLVFESCPWQLPEDLQRCIYDKLDGNVSYGASLSRIGLHSFAM